MNLIILSIVSRSIFFKALLGILAIDPLKMGYRSPQEYLT